MEHFFRIGKDMQAFLTRQRKVDGKVVETVLLELTQVSHFKETNVGILRFYRILDTTLYINLHI